MSHFESRQDGHGGPTTASTAVPAGPAQAQGRQAWIVYCLELDLRKLARTFTLRSTQGGPPFSGLPGAGVDR